MKKQHKTIDQKPLNKTNHKQLKIILNFLLQIMWQIVKQSSTERCNNYLTLLHGCLLYSAHLLYYIAALYFHQSEDDQWLATCQKAVSTAAHLRHIYESCSILQFHDLGCNLPSLLWHAKSIREAGFTWNHCVIHLTFM